MKLTKFSDAILRWQSIHLKRLSRNFDKHNCRVSFRLEPCTEVDDERNAYMRFLPLSARDAKVPSLNNLQF